MKKYLLVPIVAVMLSACNMANNDDSAMMDNQTTPAPMMQNDQAADDTTMNNDTSDGVMVGGAMMVRNKNIVENAMMASNVTTVVAAVQAADLAETLQGPGPFTVFAPTNAAFEKLPAGTVDTLLMPENKAQLQNILTYHVIPGRYTSSDLTDGMKLETVQGEELTITIMNGKVMVNGAAVVETADVISSNGVTHVIDTVLMPKE